MSAHRPIHCLQKWGTRILELPFSLWCVPHYLRHSVDVLHNQAANCNVMVYGDGCCVRPWLRWPCYNVDTPHLLSRNSNTDRCDVFGRSSDQVQNVEGTDIHGHSCRLEITTMSAKLFNNWHPIPCAFSVCIIFVLSYVLCSICKFV